MAFKILKWSIKVLYFIHSIQNWSTVITSSVRFLVLTRNKSKFMSKQPYHCYQDFSMEKIVYFLRMV